MSSKIFHFFCISLAIVLVLTSEVDARELGETSKSVDNSETAKTNGAEEDQIGYGPPDICPYGCCISNYNGCTTCCAYAGQAVDAEPHN